MKQLTDEGNTIVKVAPDGATNKLANVTPGENDNDVVVVSQLGGWTRAVIQLAQDDVRTLASANDELGFKLFSAAGENKIIQIQSPIISFNKTGGTLDDVDLYIYNATGYGTIALWRGFPASGLGNEISSFGIPMGDDAITNDVVTHSLGSIYPCNSDVYLFTSIDLSAYEGTATLIIDYRTIDLS